MWKSSTKNWRQTSLAMPLKKGLRDQAVWRSLVALFAIKHRRCDIYRDHYFRARLRQEPRPSSQTRTKCRTSLSKCETPPWYLGNASVYKTQKMLPVRQAKFVQVVILKPSNNRPKERAEKKHAGLQPMREATQGCRVSICD
jgi:hypothetical protein